MKIIANELKKTLLPMCVDLMTFDAVWHRWFKSRPAQFGQPDNWMNERMNLMCYTETRSDLLLRMLSLHLYNEIA